MNVLRIIVDTTEEVDAFALRKDEHARLLRLPQALRPHRGDIVVLTTHDSNPVQHAEAVRIKELTACGAGDEVVALVGHLTGYDARMLALTVMRPVTRTVTLTVEALDALAKHGRIRHGNIDFELVGE